MYVMNEGSLGNFGTTGPGLQYGRQTLFVGMVWYVALHTALIGLVPSRCFAAAVATTCRARIDSTARPDAPQTTPVPQAAPAQIRSPCFGPAVFTTSSTSARTSVQQHNMHASTIVFLFFHSHNPPGFHALSCSTSCFYYTNYCIIRHTWDRRIAGKHSVH